jgi:hypothetical protein
MDVQSKELSYWHQWQYLGLNYDNVGLLTKWLVLKRDMFCIVFFGFKI